MLEVNCTMGERQGCNDIVRKMLENEYKGKSKAYTAYDTSLQNYAEKLNCLLRKLFSINELDVNGKFDLRKLDKSTYNYFKKSMYILSLDFGTKNIHDWIPSTVTLDKSLYQGKWKKTQDGVVFMYRLNMLLFEVASRQNLVIKDKTYYDRLRSVQEEYSHIFLQLHKKENELVKKSKKMQESDVSMSSLESIEKEIEDRKNRSFDNETITLIRRRDTILRTQISSYRRKNINGCYNKEIKELKEKLEDSRGYIFIKDYFNEYLKLSIINDEFQFPYKLYGDREEIYYQCRDKYKKSHEQDIDKMIHDITQSIYGKGLSE